MNKTNKQKSLAFVPTVVFLLLFFQISRCKILVEVSSVNLRLPVTSRSGKVKLSLFSKLPINTGPSAAELMSALSQFYPSQQEPLTSIKSVSYLPKARSYSSAFSKLDSGKKTQNKTCSSTVHPSRGLRSKFNSRRRGERQRLRATRAAESTRRV